jgi:hypothetical protein
MGLYSKSISEIVAEKLNKNKEVEEKPEMSKKEMQKLERERLKEEKKAEREAAKLAAKEEKKLQREIAKEEKKLKKLEAMKEKDLVQEGVVRLEEEAVMDVDTVAAQESEPEPKVKTVETVKVKRSRKGGVVKKKAAEGKPPAWFVNYVKQMEAAHGVKDQEVVKESAQTKWEQKGLPEKVASEREKHVSRMYKMMFSGN